MKDKFAKMKNMEELKTFYSRTSQAPKLTVEEYKSICVDVEDFMIELKKLEDKHSIWIDTTLNENGYPYIVLYNEHSNLAELEEDIFHHEVEYSNDYACENGCCACCGCSCYDEECLP